MAQYKRLSGRRSQSPLGNPLLIASLTTNFLLLYYSIALRSELFLVRSTKPILQWSESEPCDAKAVSSEFIQSKVKYHKYPVPKSPLVDSSEKFFVDVGTYDPPVTKTRAYSILYSPKNIPEKVDLVLGLKSSLKNKDRRDAIRRSYGVNSLYKGFKAKFVFLIGASADEPSSLVEDELEEHDDILFGDFVDSFHNLTFKDSMFFTWTIHNCPDVQWAFKGDDDVLVNPFGLMAFIEENKEYEEAGIWGNKLPQQPKVKKDKSGVGKKYGDDIWPEDKYPPYVSGGGLVINRKAIFALQENIKITPIIPIDDAFIGVCMRRAGLQDHVFADKRFHVWGFRPRDELKFDVCKVAETVIVHKYTPESIDCLWPKFLKHHEECKNPEYKYVEDFPLCNPKDWHKNHPVLPPILAGPDYHHCGPKWNNSGCSTSEADWTIRKPHNGPCCSPNGYCGITKDHCDCKDCVDFRKVEKAKNLVSNHDHGVCCSKIMLESSMPYAGIFSLRMESDTSDPNKNKVFRDSSGNVEYIQEKTKEGQRIFTIKYGAYSVYGTGWYILTPEGGGLAWNVKSENSHCPVLDELEGYGGVLSCPVAQH